MSLEFSGKRILITGASKGIGRALCKSLVKNGAIVIGFGRSQKDLDSLCAEVNSSNIKTISVDLCDWDATNKAISSALPIDLLINNAGIAILEPFLEVTQESFDSVIASNVRQVICVSQVVARDMIARGVGGRIVNVSSIASQVALVDHTVYCSSKGALDQVTRTMAVELGPHKIRVNSVHPTVVMTDMGKMAWSDPAKAGPMLARTPAGKFAGWQRDFALPNQLIITEVSDVVNAIEFLLSEKADMVNGQFLGVDGGFTCS